MPLRVGVIGANPNRSWAKDSHIPALCSLENMRLAAVSTTSRASADAAAVAFGVRAAYDDPLALIAASDIDVVSVCVRVPYHRDLVLAAPDHLLVQARTISGCALAVEVAGDRPPDTPFTFEVAGTEGGTLLSGGHPNGFQAGRLTLSLNGERQQVDEPSDTLPEAAVNVATMYRALARDISSGEHTTPNFDHAVRLTHLLDDVVQSANTGHRVTREPPDTVVAEMFSRRPG